MCENLNCIQIIPEKVDSQWHVTISFADSESYLKKNQFGTNLFTSNIL